ncbi:MAG: response regulator [Myxococcales bacterium]|nr:response regulator [Myxococcales bacterium]
MHNNSQHQAILEASLPQIENRLAFLDLTPRNRETLKNFYKTLPPNYFEDFTERLYSLFRQQRPLASLMGSAEQVERLKQLQQNYLHSLLSDPFDLAYIEKRIHIGITHQRIKLTPQWYIATYAHFLIDLLDVIWQDPTRSPHELYTLVSVLFKSILFDASLTLDAYGMSYELSVIPSSTSSPNLTATLSPTFSHSAASPRPRTPDHAAPLVTRLRLSSDNLNQRTSFLNITPQTKQELLRWYPKLQTHIPELLDHFYEFIAQQKDLSRFLEHETLSRLKVQVSSYWDDFFCSPLDRSYAASRVRIGLIHERIGLSLQWYFAGLARQIDILLWTFLQESATSPDFAKTFFRMIFFDLTFILDAYLEARAENLLRTEGYAAQLIAGLNAGIAIIDEHQRIISVNQILLHLLHIEPSVLPFMPLNHALPIKGLEELVSETWKRRLPRSSMQGTLLHQKFRISVLPLQQPAEEESAKRTAILLDEIDPILQATEELKSTEQGFEHLVQSVGGVVWEADAKTWTIEMMSRPVLKLTGFRDIFFLGKARAWLEQIPNPDRTVLEDLCRELKPCQQTQLEHRFLRDDGRVVWLHSHIRVFQRERDTSLRFAGLTIDVSERVRNRKHLDERLADKEIIAQFTRSAAQNHPPQHLFQTLVETCTQLSGVSCAFIITRDLQHQYHLAAQAGDNTTLSQQTLQTRFAELFLNTPFMLGLDQPPPWLPPLQTHPKGIIISAPLIWRGNKEGVLIVLSQAEHTWTPERANVLETLANIVGLAYQRHLQESEHHHQQRLELLGLLASGIAHDLNNLLSSISISTDLLQEKIDPNAETAESFRLIEDVVARGKELAQDVLHFSKPQQEKQNTCLLEPAIESARRFTRALLSNKIELVTQLETQAKVPIAARHLQQVILNLALNAAQAIAEQGKITISGKETSFLSTQQFHSGPLPPGHYVEVSVEDNGAGIPPQIIPRLFEPFFTTKSHQQGTGMGLSVLLHLIEDAKGAIDLSTQLGRGTRFTIYLPLLEEPATNERTTQTAIAVLGASPPTEDSPKHILLVDDEPILQQAVGTLLQRHGFTVSLASSVQQALDIMREKESNIHAILTDQNMPHLTGIELIEIVHQEFGQIPTLLFSGLPLQLPSQLKNKGVSFLQKPFQIQKLLQIIHNITSSPKRTQTP